MPTEIEGVKFYTILETAKKLDLTGQTIRTYIKQGRLKSYKIGGPILITENSLKEFMTINKATQRPIRKKRVKTT